MINLSSVNQTNAHEITSQKYSFIPTTTAITVLADHGWHPAKATQKRSAKYDGFQKHIIRFRNEAFAPDNREFYPELVLTNSHHGACAFKLMLGLYRLVCANGLTVGETYNSTSIRHVGYTDNLLSSAIDSITAQAPKLFGQVDQWRGIELKEEEQHALAKAAIPMIFDGERYAIEPRSLLLARRYNDRSNDLWSTFNRIQEHAIKGGVRQTRTDGTRIRSRKVNNIDRDLKINQALWTLGEEMARLKTA